MPNFWNLATNELTSISTELAEKRGCEPVNTLDGGVVYIPRVTDIYGVALQRAKELALRLGAETAESRGIGCHQHPELDGLNPARLALSVVNSLRVEYVLRELLQSSHRRNAKFIAIRQFLHSCIFDCSVPITNGPSKSFQKTLAKKCLEATPERVCAFYNINGEALSAMSVGAVVRVFAKSFVLEDGAGFVLARIISEGGITVAREGVSESVSAEYAELELLKRVSAVASKSGNSVEIVSGQLNIVDWLNDKNEPKTHLELRAEIMSWMEAVGYTVRQMTKEENKAYRDEKKGK
jgi:hypothetical protein